MLITCSLVGLTYWEVCGREQLTTRPVLAAASELPKGTILAASDLKLIHVGSDVYPQGSLAPGQEALAEGKAAAVDLHLNQPVTAELLEEQTQLFEDGQSVFSLPGEWIYARPSFLRAGDTIAVYLLPEKQKIGSFTIAYVRDSAEQAVLGDEDPKDGVLNRNGASGIIASVEILCKPRDYFAIYDRAINGPAPQAPLESDESEEAPSFEDGEAPAPVYGYDESIPYAGEPQLSAEPQPFLLLVLEEAAP
ncbi:MAG: hypothetical protein HUJ80_03775 [Firmicutes bacterium]|nr:hypothetical protein [Bacillota bacterium]